MFFAISISCHQPLIGLFRFLKALYDFFHGTDAVTKKESDHVQVSSFFVMPIKLTTWFGSKSTRCSTRNGVNWDNDQSIYNDKSVPNDGGAAESAPILIISWRYKYESILRNLLKLNKNHQTIK